MNKSKVDFSKQPMFLGEELNIQRYDKFSDEYFYKFLKQQLGAYWVPNEVDLSLDGTQFEDLSDVEKRVFTLNLKYQILLDSTAARGLPYLAQYVSTPELEAAFNAWTFFETIHSLSYTYLIQNVYPNPTEVLDSVMDDEHIVARSQSLTRCYDSLVNDLGENDYDLRKKIYLTMVSVNILESIRFVVSFACTYSFAETGRLEGSAKIIQLIERDERSHMAASTVILNKMANEEFEGFMDVAVDCKSEVLDMFREAAEEEIKWSEYLFKDGGILGLNNEVMTDYIHYLVNRRLKALKLTPLFEDIDNPIPWVDAFGNSKSVQVANMETEGTSYKVGAFKNDIDEVDFGMDF